VGFLKSVGLPFDMMYTMAMVLWQIPFLFLWQIHLLPAPFLMFTFMPLSVFPWSHGFCYSSWLQPIQSNQSLGFFNTTLFGIVLVNRQLKQMIKFLCLHRHQEHIWAKVFFLSSFAAGCYFISICLHAFSREKQFVVRPPLKFRGSAWA